VPVIYNKYSLKLCITVEQYDYDDCYFLTPTQQFFSASFISWREQVNFEIDDNEVRFVLYQHTITKYNFLTIEK
jgi:hypothetical protein